ncbi:hypothetical protein [Pontimicrobium sp. IMCC45349]|uniref:hypothetical protein n=1 Tax=Pontimicrobium sp. IMCC45349 TaxID=3391574 RepID=UPI0039A3E8A2
MNELKLHSSGRTDHLQSLKERYEILKNKINCKKLNETEKSAVLDKLKKSFEKRKKESENNLY